ncbi:hypothetical protein KUTeg_015837 [Tegillarca granosa]|uniref:XK-related protein n=1 Tax=Tegillarca granosa TaxID=220873 RepID=A0ABQ9ENV8_TEGGR|nr:hypothetical protein KUTeg_015837 [Tegillarca granosa]
MAFSSSINSYSRLKNFKVPCSRRVAYELSKRNEFEIVYKRNNDSIDPRTDKGPRSATHELVEDGKLSLEFTNIDLIVTVISILFFFYDVVSDIILAYEYYSLGRWLHFGLTTAFIAAPAVISNIHSIVWYKKDYIVEKETREKDHNFIETSRKVWYCRVMHIEYIYHGIKSRSKCLPQNIKEHHHQQMLFEDIDAGLMRMLEGFLEAAPQLILQMYILITERPEEAIYMTYIRPVAMLGSWIGVTWSLVSYYKAMRAVHEVRDGTAETVTDVNSFFKFLFKTGSYFLYRASEVGPRVVIIALFASQFSYFIFVALGIHWLIMFVWLRCQKTHFYKDTERKKRAEIVFNMIVAYICIFCFLNPRDGHTRYRALLYYILFHVENLIMMLAWLYFTDDKSDWFYFATMLLVPLGLFFQIFFQLLFYNCFHTKKNEIKCCLWPIENYNCFVSVCHEVDLDRPPEPVAKPVLGNKLHTASPQKYSQKH